MSRMKGSAKSEFAPAVRTEGDVAVATRPSMAMRPVDEMRHLMERLWNGHGFPWVTNEWPMWPVDLGEIGERIPNVDVVERDKEFCVRAELPGVDKDDLEVTVTDTALTITAETKYEKEEEDGDYYRSEIGHGSFLRRIPLPAEVVGDKAEATFKNGMLEVLIPKSSPGKGKSVPVK